MFSRFDGPLHRWLNVFVVDNFIRAGLFNCVRSRLHGLLHNCSSLHNSVRRWALAPSGRLRS